MTVGEAAASGDRSLELPELSPEVQLGDGIEGLAALPPHSVDLLLSDLPSGETRAPFDQKPPIGELWGAARGALAPQGVSLMQWLVRTYCPCGGLVADPFAGSGSAGYAALASGRRFVGWDTSSEFAIP